MHTIGNQAWAGRRKSNTLAGAGGKASHLLLQVGDLCQHPRPGQILLHCCGACPSPRAFARPGRRRTGTTRPPLPLGGEWLIVPFLVGQLLFLRGFCSTAFSFPPSRLPAARSPSSLPSCPPPPQTPLRGPPPPAPSSSPRRPAPCSTPPLALWILVVENLRGCG